MPTYLFYLFAAPILAAQLFQAPAALIEEMPKAISDELAIINEISFVKTRLNEFGFIPQETVLIAYRGDSRSPEEIQQEGGFLRKAFGDKTKIPSIRADGGVRHMIGFSKDITVAMGFAKHNVKVQREEEAPHIEGWVYAVYLTPGQYYDPTNFPYAFLADWGREVDAIYVPYDKIIGAIKVSSWDSTCIHCYLTRIPQELHSIRGCTHPYLDQFTLDIQSLWINPYFSSTVSEDMISLCRNLLKEIYDIGKYTITLDFEGSEESVRISNKYREYLEQCSQFSQQDKDLTAILSPTVEIKYIPEVL